MAMARVDQARGRAGQHRHGGEDRFEPRAPLNKVVEPRDDPDGGAGLRIEGIESRGHQVHADIVPMCAKKG
jgi:hypothetical protein